MHHLRRRIGLAVVAVIVATSCSGDDDVSALPDRTSTTPTSQTTTTTSTTTLSTTSTSSETAQAESEIEQLITDWWTKAYDPEEGDGMGGQEYLTGLIAIRVAERQAEAAEEGFVRATLGGAVIEITSVEVDLVQGTAIATSCGGSDIVRLSAQTGEQINEGDDPDYRTTSEWYLESTTDGWKISEWFPSFNSGNPIECVIGDE